MIIPIKCFTCGTLLANKYAYYCEEVRKRKLARGAPQMKPLYPIEIRRLSLTMTDPTCNRSQGDLQDASKAIDMKYSSQFTRSSKISSLYFFIICSIYRYMYIIVSNLRISKL